MKNAINKIKHFKFFWFSIPLLFFYLTYLLCNKIINLANKITSESSIIDLETNINDLNIVFLLTMVFSLLFIVSSFYLLINYLIIQSTNEKNHKAFTLFGLMFFIICFTIICFSYIYMYSDILIGGYAETIKTIEDLVQDMPEIKLKSYNKKIIEFIKNFDPEYNKIFINNKEFTKDLDNNSNEIFKITKFDYILFSVATFFSSSYTTIIPNNIIIHIIVLLENITTFIITIIYIPIIINFIQIKKKGNKDKSNVVLKLQQDKCTLIYELKDVIEKK